MEEKNIKMRNELINKTRNVLIVIKFVSSVVETDAINSDPFNISN